MPGSQQMNRVATCCARWRPWRAVPEAAQSLAQEHRTGGAHGHRATGTSPGAPSADRRRGARRGGGDRLSHAVRDRAQASGRRSAHRDSIPGQRAAPAGPGAQSFGFGRRHRSCPDAAGEHDDIPRACARVATGNTRGPRACCGTCLRTCICDPGCSEGAASGPGAFAGAAAAATTTAESTCSRTGSPACACACACAHRRRSATCACAAGGPAAASGCSALRRAGGSLCR